MDGAHENPFTELWDLGYTRLVPVIPPNVEVAANGQLAARIRAGSDPRGKAPGTRRADGTWQGLHFVAMESRREDLDAWNAMGASVGVKTGQGLIAIDIDTTDKKAASTIYTLASTHLGHAQVRFGRHPKCLLLYRAPETVTYRRVQFATDSETKAAVEMLAEGRQFVAKGTHPTTGKPYAWPHGIPARDTLTRVSAEQIDAFFRAVADALPGAKLENSAAEREQDQEALQAPDFDTLKRLVEATPNTSDMFPSRESYVRMAYAIKGATPDGYEHEALDLFLDWCAKWHGPDGETNDLDIALADWNRAKPPYRAGINFLRQHAIDLYLQPVQPDEVEDMFAGQTQAQAGSTRKRFELLTDEQMQTRPDPRWLISRHIPEEGFGILYGDPGTGKSFLALDMALTIATGKAHWHGEPVAEAPAVLYIAGEGAGDFKLRMQAWKERNWFRDEMIPPDRFRVIIEPLNFMRKEDTDTLLQAVKEAGIPRLSLIIVDTVSRAIAGADENKQQDMSIFVQACDSLRVATGAFVLGVHHAAKTGDLRGSTAIPGGADAIWRFERKKGQHYGRLQCMKMKAADDNVTTAFRLDKVDLGDEKSSLVPTRVEEKEVMEASCSEEMQQQIFRAIQDAAEAMDHWSMAPQAAGQGRKYAVHEIQRGWKVEPDVAKQWLDMWLSGPEPVLKVIVIDPRSKRRGLIVADNLSESILD